MTYQHIITDHPVQLLKLKIHFHSSDVLMRLPRSYLVRLYLPHIRRLCFQLVLPNLLHCFHFLSVHELGLFDAFESGLFLALVEHSLHLAVVLQDLANVLCV